MNNKETDKCRPYLAHFSKDELPVLVNSVKEFKTDLEPQLHNMAKAFANHKTGKLQHKLCVQKCAVNKRCTKKCIEERNKRLNEPILVDRVESRLGPIIRTIERGEDPDTIVMIELREFACSGIVLGSYSNFFAMCRGQTVIDLRKAPLTADTFEQIYKWMIRSNVTFLPKDVVRFVRAACFLEMQELLEQCYAMLDCDEFKEFWAFSVMYTSRYFHELYQINQAMATRISKSTLIIICSQEFLHLSEMQICALLRSSSLSVNSETELLYGVLHWLDVDWPARMACVGNVLKNIRFAYLAPKILCQLNGLDRDEMGPFGHVLDVFSRVQEKKKLIEDGIFYSTLVITMGGDTSKFKELPSARKELMVPRRWVQDTRCTYHRPVTKLCPNMRSISYEEFVTYSETLQESDTDYEQYILYPTDDDYCSTKLSTLFEQEPSMSGHSWSSNMSCCSDVSEVSDSCVWDSQSIKSWVRLESPISYQMDNISICSVSTGSESRASPRMQISADKASTHWHESIKEFRPSAIWQKWESSLLTERNE
ncbi:uncharacterized protein LOC115758089 isoform X1 [Drosophila novamexicana]|uniref:uncharacterized protein LOC115758089 isoform X1 n=2 Tax=Drosophila novamexicana TaxID=47314 RepID=UPI0011E5E25C|nr:uncharacterized protein LOC115758089 isoform X1 [Drosophila novamexicana]